MKGNRASVLNALNCIIHRFKRCIPLQVDFQENFPRKTERVLNQDSNTSMMPQEAFDSK